MHMRKSPALLPYNAINALTQWIPSAYFTLQNARNRASYILEALPSNGIIFVSLGRKGAFYRSNPLNLNAGLLSRLADYRSTRGEFQMAQSSVKAPSALTFKTNWTVFPFKSDKSTSTGFKLPSQLLVHSLSLFRSSPSL